MHLRPLRCFSALFLLGTLAACDSEVGKALAKAADANNNAPGEADGRAVTITTTTPRNSAAATDGTNFVFVEDNGDVFQVPATATAGTPTKLGSFGPNEGQRADVHIEVDANYIWYMSTLMTNGLYRMPRAGGAAEKVADTSANNPEFALAADAVYFLGSAELVKKLDLATKAVTDFSTGLQNSRGLVLDKEHNKLFLTDVGANAILSVDITAPAPVTAVKLSDQPSPEAMTIGNGYIYWSNGQLGEPAANQEKIYRLKTDGTGQPEIVTEDKAEFPHPLAVDANFLYAGAGSGIKRVSLTPGGAYTQFLNISLADFVISGTTILAVENNGFHADAEAQKKPNRILARNGVKADLDRANAAIEKADWGAALELLLEAWREKRVGRLADVIDRASDRVDHAPIAAKGVGERTAKWLELAEKKQSRDVGTLLATPWPKKWQDGVPMVESLEKLPDDPRIGMALARIVEATPTDSWASYAFYRPILRVVAKTADPRAKLVLAADLAKEKSRFWNQRNRQLVINAYAEMADPPELTAAEEKALVALEARFATEFQAARSTAKSEADFLAAIYAAPDDDAPRAIYADWLTEHGDARGEFIALQLTPDRTPVMKKRIGTLLRKHGKAWAGPLDKIISKEGRIFTRGFLSHAVIDNFMQKGAVAQALAHPEWALVESLSLGYGGQLFARDLVTRPWRKNLRAVHGIPGEQFADLADFDRLEELHVRLDNQTSTAPLVELSKLARLMIDTIPEALVTRLGEPLPPALERVIVVQWIVNLSEIADAAHKAKIAVPVVEVRREYYSRGQSHDRYELRRDADGHFTRLRVTSPADITVHPTTLVDAMKSLPSITELVFASSTDDWTKEGLAKVKRAIAKLPALKTQSFGPSL